MLSLLELTEEDCFGHVYIFHPCDVASPAQLYLKQDEFRAGQAGFLDDFFIYHVVLPSPRIKRKQRDETAQGT